nr:MAG TPA: hypothetical protein [Caudoviricetes sp.]
MGQLEENIALIKGERNEGGNTKERVAETFEMLAAELTDKMDKDDYWEILKSNISIIKHSVGPIPPANVVNKELHIDVISDVDWVYLKTKRVTIIESEEDLGNIVFKLNGGVRFEGHNNIMSNYDVNSKNVSFLGDETEYFVIQRYENIRLGAKDFVSIETPQFKINNVDILKKINALEDTINKLQEEINSLKKGN